MGGEFALNANSKIGTEIAVSFWAYSPKLTLLEFAFQANSKVRNWSLKWKLKNYT